jgi:polar amino acid transport system substrate-binding protein
LKLHTKTTSKVLIPEGYHENCGSAALESLQDCNQPQVKLAVFANSVQQQVAKQQFPRAQPLTLEGDTDQLAPVKDGTAHALLVSTFTPEVIASVAGDLLVLVDKKPLATTVSAMGMRKGDADFLSYLNTGLTDQKDSGWLEERAGYWGKTANWMP